MDAMHELHRDKEVFLDLSKVVDVDDVGMGESRCQSRLVLEHPDKALVIQQMREDALDRDKAIETIDARLAGDKDLRHTTPRNASEKGVVAERDA